MFKYEDVMYLSHYINNRILAIQFKALFTDHQLLIKLHLSCIDKNWLFMIIKIGYDNIKT